MQAQSITSYRGSNSLRVAQGDHKVHEGAAKDRITVYPSLAAAKKFERHDLAVYAQLERFSEGEEPAEPVGGVTFYYETKGSIVEHSCPARLFAVRAYAMGYYPITVQRVTAEQLNRGVPPEVLQSALEASVFGWDCPAAIPARKYIEQRQREVAA